MGKKIRSKEVHISPRLRVMWGGEIALGPGRVELLELIGETGNLRAAALKMGVSYMRAWNLVKYTNRCFSQPLVEAIRGGRTGGGAKLTEVGQEVVSEYREMEKESQKAILRTGAAIRRHLKK
jgi:molybdate transport system regulatory protein